MRKIYISLALMFISVFAFSQWTQLTSGTTNALNSLYFTDNNTGYDSGMPGCIYKTSNGGNDWNNISVMIDSLGIPSKNTVPAVLNKEVYSLKLIFYE
jgi:photosystem II stability/assembly factor-like uncharacterized protein